MWAITQFRMFVQMRGNQDTPTPPHSELTWKLPPGMGSLGRKDFPDPVVVLSNFHLAVFSPALVSGGS